MIQKWLYGPEKFPGLSRNRPLARENADYVTEKQNILKPYNSNWSIIHAL